MWLIPFFVQYTNFHLKLPNTTAMDVGYLVLDMLCRWITAPGDADTARLDTVLADEIIEL